MQCDIITRRGIEKVIVHIYGVNGNEKSFLKKVRNKWNEI